MSAVDGKTRLKELTDEQIIDALPHGSGIDASWSISRLKNGSIVCACSYHGMDDNGMYDGWQDFTVKLFAIESPAVCPQCQGRGFRTIGDIAKIRQCDVETINRDDLHVEWIDALPHDANGPTSFLCNSCHGNYRPQTIDFKVSFTGYRQSRSKSWVWGLRDYLEQTIHWALSEANILTAETSNHV